MQPVISLLSARFFSWSILNHELLRLLFHPERLFLGSALFGGVFADVFGWFHSDPDLLETPAVWQGASGIPDGGAEHQARTLACSRILIALKLHRNSLCNTAELSDSSGMRAFIPLAVLGLSCLVS